MTFRLVQELAADGVIVTVTCRVLCVSSSGYYEWRGRAPSLRAVADQTLSAQIIQIHHESRGSYGVSRVHAELRLGCGVRCGRKRVARLMRSAGLQGIYKRRGKRRCPAPPVHDDLVKRRFVADAPNRLWLTDITEHPTREGKVYLAAVLDVYGRRVGWSIADHLRAELVVDALEMARWRRRPVPGGETPGAARLPRLGKRPRTRARPAARVRTGRRPRVRGRAGSAPGQRRHESIERRRVRTSR